MKKKMAILSLKYKNTAKMSSHVGIFPPATDWRIQESQVWNIIYSVKQFDNISGLELFTEELSRWAGLELILLLDSGGRGGLQPYTDW